MNSMIQHPARTTTITKNKNLFQPTLHSYIKDEFSSLNKRKRIRLSQDDGDDGVVVHPTPLPDNNPKSFLSQLARCGNRKCVLYLCMMPTAEKYHLVVSHGTCFQYGKFKMVCQLEKPQNPGKYSLN